MLNRRSILSGIFGVSTTPALIAPQPKSDGSGEKRKYVLIVADGHMVSKTALKRLGEHLLMQGFSCSAICVNLAPEPIRVIDLSNLPEADLEEVRRLCERARR